MFWYFVDQKFDLKIWDNKDKPIVWLWSNSLYLIKNNWNADRLDKGLYMVDKAGVGGKMNKSEMT